MKPNAYFDTFDTALGEFSLAVNELNAVVATAFGDESLLASRLKGTTLKRDANRAAEARQQVIDFLGGNRDQFNLTLAAQGSPFQQQVWAELCAIPLGKTRTYGEIAARLDKPGAARAVGRANASNPICLIIPCHRVIAGNGSLHGFAFGQAIKSQLLKREGVSI
jgi:methylated-DNA-[protein]-cysteine S-methyltransferase